MDVPEISNDEAAGLAERGATFLDVREGFERVEARIPGTVHAPMQQSLAWVAEHVPDQSTPIVVTCLSGARSAVVVAHLRQMGYVDAHNHRGGLQSWAMQGLPVEQGPEA